MKKYFLLIIVFLSISPNQFPHGQNVHQYMVRQAYQLLKNTLGYDIPEMAHHLGNSEQGEGLFNPGGKLVIGAFQEDVTDATLGYFGSFVFGLKLHTFSI